MALKLITGDTFKAEFDGVMAELKRNYLADRRAMHVVLVPDKFSLTMEKEVLESLNLEAPTCRFCRFCVLRAAR